VAPSSEGPSRAEKSRPRLDLHFGPSPSPSPQPNPFNPDSPDPKEISSYHPPSRGSCFFPIIAAHSILPVPDSTVQIPDSHLRPFRTSVFFRKFSSLSPICRLMSDVPLWPSRKAAGQWHRRRRWVSAIPSMTLACDSALVALRSHPTQRLTSHYSSPRPTAPLQESSSHRLATREARVQDCPNSHHTPHTALPRVNAIDTVHIWRQSTSFGLADLSPFRPFNPSRVIASSNPVNPDPFYITPSPQHSI